jgi:hypothetical protein
LDVGPVVTGPDAKWAQAPAPRSQERPGGSWLGPTTSVQ